MHLKKKISFSSLVPPIQGVKKVVEFLFKQQQQQKKIFLVLVFRLSNGYIISFIELINYYQKIILYCKEITCYFLIYFIFKKMCPNLTYDTKLNQIPSKFLWLFLQTFVLAYGGSQQMSVVRTALLCVGFCNVPFASVLFYQLLRGRLVKKN